MASLPARGSTFPVGIDLGTTYSCISTLTPQGQPVTLPNSEGELSTPSVVLFEQGELVVGTEALRRSIASPERVVQFAKRHLGDPNKCWVFDGHVYRPKDISSFILKKLLEGAEDRLGKIRHAVITVPAQFSELQRRDTVEAGLQAGLERVDIIHEPVAAALCYVLSEGMWFAELANEQTILVFDLGGGTFDLSLVKYNQQAVRVLASGGDLRLGGLDWNKTLEEFLCDEFIKESISDPRLDRESMQALAIEVEQLKRSLSVRPRSTATIQHAGRRKSYQIDREQFEILTRPLVERTRQHMIEMLKAHKLGWANVDTVLATGGASRMPMIRSMLQQMSGTTLNQTLSPDQSICHGAAYYAGMLLTGQKLRKTNLNKQAEERLANFKQQSVSGRSLGILVRDVKSNERVPHYLLPANTPLPCAFRQRFGTVVTNQKKVHLHIIESGTSPDDPCVEIGECVVHGLPEKLPVGAPIEVTIRYDEQARVHLEAVDVTSGVRAETTIVRPPIRPEGASVPPAAGPAKPDSFTLAPGEMPPVSMGATHPEGTPAIPGAEQQVKARPAAVRPPAKFSPQKITPRKTALERAERPIPLCNDCGEALNHQGQCPSCKRLNRPAPRRPRKPGPARSSGTAAENQVPTEKLIVPPTAPSSGPAKFRKKN
jgi:molecular chaperone DnaK